jgi:hypothetical protein
MRRKGNEMSTLTAKATVIKAAISEIAVAGFKSIRDEQKIEIRPLTILAGANSSGKSSMMQPLLLLKQTLEAPYDPGPILLNGPILKFTLADQLFSRSAKGRASGNFVLSLRLSSGDSLQSTFCKEHKHGLGIERTEIRWDGKEISYWPEMRHDEILKAFRENGIDLSADFATSTKKGQWEIKRYRCFIGPVWVVAGTGTSLLPTTNGTIGARPGPVWEEIVPEIIYLPGLRGNPDRVYPAAVTSGTFAGPFQAYTASLISEWMTNGEAILNQLNAELKQLELTGGVTAVRINDAQIELHVGRLRDLPPTGPENRVNIADVGLGTSQVLPLLVALHAAKPGQLVYVEQPETHLHPRAQTALAGILGEAAKRGVRVVVETHSSLILLGVQTLVAEEKLDPDKVKLHWFQRDNDGKTTVESGGLDEAGRIGEWPEDFDDVTLRAQKEYLDASSKRLFAQ